jgi:bromodomain-containing protein 1
LDKLDLTCSMKSSGSRSKRAKLLKKEIAVLRNKLSQQHSQSPSAGPGTGGFEEDATPLGPDPGEEGKRGAVGGLCPWVWESCSYH